MSKKQIREWKKVYISDLTYIVFETKELTKQPAMIILEGDVGVGKTTFCQHFVGSEQTLSPTYSILSETKNILHGDFYRLDKADEIIQLEIGLYLEDKQFFLAEWGTRFAKRLLRELPETYSAYVLDITIAPTNTSTPSLETPRNFVLSSLIDD